MKVETIAEQLLFATLRIQAVRPGQPDSVGTGFIVTHKWSDDKQGPFLITNRHVIDGTMQGQLNFTLGSQNGDGLAPLIGKSTSITLGQDAWGWIYHPRNDIDIAALPVAPVVKHLANKNELPYYKSIPTDLIPTQEKLEDLDAVEEVLFVGYPSGIYDSVNNLPITRKGISATPLSIDYEGKPVFLVDASVFPGSSGSPVFIYNNGYWATRKGRLMSGNRVFFLGVLGGVYNREDESIFRIEEVPTALRPVVKTRQMIDLGIVYKAHTVVEAIEHLLRQRGELPTVDAT